MHAGCGSLACAKQVHGGCPAIICAQQKIHSYRMPALGHTSVVSARLSGLETRLFPSPDKFGMLDYGQPGQPPQGACSQAHADAAQQSCRERQNRAFAQ